MFLAHSETLSIEGIQIPKYGSITVFEYLFLRDWWRSPTQISQDNAIQLLQAFQMRQVMATLLLVSRSSPTWTLEEVAELFSVEQIYQLSNWLAGEWVRWKPVPKQLADSDSSTNEPKEIDWEEVYWKLQLWYPGHPQFSAENFGNCPIATIENACETYLKERRSDLHLREIGLATISSILINVNRSKKSKPSKPSDFFYFADRAIALPSKVCNTFWYLAQNALIPNWAIEVAPIEELKHGRSSSPTGKHNYWIGEQIVLIEPEVWERDITTPLALIYCQDGFVFAEDLDATKWAIAVPEECWGKLAAIDFEGTLN